MFENQDEKNMLVKTGVETIAPILGSADRPGCRVRLLAVEASQKSKIRASRQKKFVGLTIFVN